MSNPREQPLAPVTLIPLGHDGKLNSPAGELPVRVFERGQDLLMLVVLLDADTGLPPESLEPVLLEYGSDHGLVRLRGEATIEQRDLIRFRAGEAPDVVQRREFVRIGAAQRVELVDPHAESATEAHAVDLSGGGMLLRGLEQFAEGDRLRFSLELGANVPPIHGTAKVVRTGDGGECGVVFESIDPSERERLIHFIFDRQRAARAKTRDGTRRKRRTA